MLTDFPRSSPRLGLLLLGLVVAMGIFTLWITAPSQASSLNGGPVLPRAVEMQPGDRALFPDGSYLTFIGIVEDSRCPADAMCIWQGRAVALFEYAGEQYEMVYLGHDAIDGSLPGYNVIIHDVQPYPLASIPTADEDYRLTVTVEVAR